LIEITMVIVILGILAAIGAPLLINAFSAYEITHSNIDTLSKLRYATERMAREIREVGYAAGSYTIATRTAATMSFTKSDATVVTITCAPPLITLAYSTVAGGAQTLVDQVGSCDLFTYLQADGATAATTNGNVAIVDIVFSLQNPDSGAYAQRTRVALRNRQ
jgi:Tfp pilus assembly protein PilE